ncbi:hypothetical protein BDR05DRAFT_953389 [Suillus weaverae]|nr:hypothetical protein BDR05DRAFT_953389 [Suillus weaverae]
MNRPNIADYLNVASAQDQWEDSRSLDMGFDRFPSQLVSDPLDMGFPPSSTDQWEDSRSLDMGFDRFPSQPVSDPLDMGFPPLSNTNQSSIATPISELDMVFPPRHSSFNTNDFPDPATSSLNFLAHDRLAGGSVNDILVKDSLLDMGFNSPPVHHGHLNLDMGFHSPVQHSHPDETPLDMGFDSPVPHHDPDQMSLDMGFNSPLTWVLIHLWFIIIRTRGLPALIRLIFRIRQSQNLWDL